MTAIVSMATARSSWGLVLALSFLSAAAWADPPPMRGLEEVAHAQVELRGGFWDPRLKTHHEVTVPHALNCLEKDGHVTNFDKAAGIFDGPLQVLGPTGQVQTQQLMPHDIAGLAWVGGRLAIGLSSGQVVLLAPP